MEKLIEKYQIKHDKVLNAYQTKKDLTEDDIMYLRDKMRGLLEVIKDLKSVGKKVDTRDRQLTMPDVRLALSGFWAWYAELSIEELEWYNGKEVQTYLATL